MLARNSFAVEPALPAIAPEASPKLRVVNLTERVVVSEVSSMLSSPDYLPYRHLFAQDALRNWLIRYAMRRVDSFYRVIRRGEAINHQDFWAIALIQKPKVRAVVAEGIQFVNLNFSKQQRQFGRPEPDKDVQPLNF